MKQFYYTPCWWITFQEWSALKRKNLLLRLQDRQTGVMLFPFVKLMENTDVRKPMKHYFWKRERGRLSKHGHLVG